MIKQNFEKSVVLIVLFSLLYALISSIHWILPFISDPKGFLPFFRFFNYTNLAPNVGTDAYIYYAFIRDIIDGYFIFSDPLTLENKNYFSIYNTYNLSLLFASIPGIFTKDIAIIYMYNSFLFSFLNFLTVSIFIRYFIKSTIYIILIATLIFFFTHPLNIVFQLKEILTYLINFNFKGLIDYSSIFIKNNEAHRLPSILITNIHLFVTFFIIIKDYFNKEKYYYPIIIILLGSSTYISIQNFLITYFFITSMLILNFNLLDYRKKIIKIILLSLVISIPGIMLLLEEYLKINFTLIETNFDKLDIMTNNVLSSITIHKYIFLKKIIKFTLIFSIVFLLNSKYKKIFLSIYLSIILPYIIITLFKGSSMGERILFRGGELMINTTMFIILFIFLTKINFFKKILNSKYIIFTNTIFILFIFFLMFSNQFLINKKNPKVYFNKDFKNIYYWINNNAKKEDTFITLDPKIISNLPVYSKVNMYISQGLIGRSNINDRMRRFLEICKFYGLEINNIENLHFNNNKLLKYENTEKYDDIIKQFNHIIFSTDDKNFFIEYKNILKKEAEYIFKKNSLKLNFDNDYIILSKFDKNLINESGYINKFLNISNLVFKNKSYSIFKIPEDK